VNLRISAAVAAAVIASGIFAVARAPQSPAKPASDPAKSLAHLLQEHYRQPKTLKAAFLERYSEGKNDAKVESGTVFFRRPGEMRWEYDSPEKKLFLVDGKNTWFYVPYDHTVTKSPVKESSDWRTPLSLLTGKADLARLCSEIEVVSQPNLPNGHAVLRCLPKEPKGTPDQSGYTEVFLELDSTTGELARIDIHEPGGIDLEYRFGNWETDIPLSADQFHFQVPAGVAIVDGTTLPESPL
jgi:outer membrane lipoprotein carrier protein